MKIIISIISLLFFISTEAQMTILDDEGNLIEDGAQFSFQTIDEDPAKLHFYIKNEFSNQIGVKAKITEMIASDGTNVQFCMGECLFSISEGTEVPENGAFTVEANSTSSGPGTYFWNLDDSDNVITYRFKIYQVDALGNETGEPTNINYVYDPNLSTDKNSLSSTKIYPTVTSSIININLKENATAEIFNLQGKLVQTLQLKESLSSIDVSTFSSGVYLIKLKGESNYTATKKFVKK